MVQSPRGRLLGSLQGQLQFSTILVLFVGLTTASSASLWIIQSTLTRERNQDLHEQAEIIQACITRLTQATVAGVSPTAIQEELPLCLQGRRDAHTAFALQLADGRLILPEPSSRFVPNATVASLLQPTLSATSQGNVTLKQRGIYFLLHRHQPSRWGSQLIAIENLSERSSFLTTNLMAFGLIWLVLLVLTAAAVTVVVTKATAPLRYLSGMADSINADTLPSTRLALRRAPREVAQLADSYNHLLDRLTQASNHQRQFVSAVSHELRNPLTLISGYIRRVLRRGENLSEDQRKALGIVETETHRIIRLISQLLDLSRSDSGNLVLETTPVLISHELQEVADLARSTLSRPLHLELPAEPAERALLTRANPDRLRQVLMNLIENANKYSPTDAAITISLRHQSQSMIIEVADQGIGIPSDEIDCVFDRFYRARNTTAVEGSGIGLAVVKVIVESMGGTISVHSRVDEGSRFQLAFPLATASPSPPADAANATAPEALVAD